MQWSTILKLLFLIAGLMIITQQAVGAVGSQKRVIYQTDFSESPGWTTNSPTRYYWDPPVEMYHFGAEGGTNAYSFVPIDYNGESFVLEYDVIINSATKDGAFRMGVTSSEMDITKGSNVLSVFEYGKYGRLMQLRVIDQNNHLHEAMSYYASYCGDQTGCESKYFQENVTYHVTLRYNKDFQNADIKIVEAESGNLAWGYYVNIGAELYFMNRLAITTRGDYTYRSSAEGYIDNVELYTLEKVTPTPTATATTAEPTPATTVPTTVPTTTPTPTQSPVPPLLTLIALGAGLLCLLFRNHKR